jgi:hypothetical protein
MSGCWAQKGWVSFGWWLLWLRGRRGSFWLKAHMTGEGGPCPSDVYLRIYIIGAAAWIDQWMQGNFHLESGVTTKSSAMNAVRIVPWLKATGQAGFRTTNCILRFMTDATYRPISCVSLLHPEVSNKGPAPTHRLASTLTTKCTRTPIRHAWGQFPTLTPGTRHSETERNIRNEWNERSTEWGNPDLSQVSKAKPMSNNSAVLKEFHGYALR